MVVLLRVVFLVVSEEGVELNALLEILGGLETPDVLEEVKDLVPNSDGICILHSLNKTFAPQVYSTKPPINQPRKNPERII